MPLNTVKNRIILATMPPIIAPILIRGTRRTAIKIHRQESSRYKILLSKNTSPITTETKPKIIVAKSTFKEALNTCPLKAVIRRKEISTEKKRSSR